MPLPSPSRQTTLRSGHATAAPVATGIPMPIEPPVFESQSCGAAARVGAKKPRPVVTASSTTIAFSGSIAASEAPRFSGVIAPVASFGAGASVSGGGIETFLAQGAAGDEQQGRLARA